MKNPAQHVLAIGLILLGVLFNAPSPAQIYYIHNDQLATPKALTDQNQNVVWSADAAPYCNATTTGAVTFNLRFPGQYYDQETGLHYNRARYYDPTIGRFINKGSYQQRVNKGSSLCMNSIHDIINRIRKCLVGVNCLLVSRDDPRYAGIVCQAKV